MHETRPAVLSGARNDRWVDVWSATHVLWGIVLGYWIDPFWALVVLIAWEPLEILVLSPLVERLSGIKFGHESWKNAMSDIFFDAAGVAVGGYLLPNLV